MVQVQVANGVATMAAPTTRWMRLARRLGCDGNPLRRRSDRIEARLLPAAIAIFLALSPLVVGVTGMWIRADNAAARHAQLSWHPVTAVLVQAAPGPEVSDNGANTWIVWTPARWTVDGRQRVGDVPAVSGSRAGSTETVWLNRAGKVQMPPLTAGQVGNLILTVASIALVVLAMLLVGLAILIRRALERRRLAAWETAWLAVGPRWSHQS